MTRPNFGPKNDLALRLSSQDKATAALSTRNVLQNASIGVGGLLVYGGGSITVTGGGSITLPTGTLSAAAVVGTSTVSSPAVIGNDLYTLNGPSFNITGTRVAAWLESATGRVGMATSSERFKTDIRRLVDQPDFAPFAVLELDMMLWSYLAEVARRDDPDSADYVGPDYHVPTNFGPIVERAHELGLWMLVVYEADPIVVMDRDNQQRAVGLELRRDENGDPIPFGFHDALFGYLLQVAVKKMRQEQLRDRRLLLALYRTRHGG